MLKCTRAEAILRMMKFDQLGILPYSAQVTVPILLLQEFVLQDRIQRADTNTLNKSEKKFETNTSKKKNNSLHGQFFLNFCSRL